MADPLAWLDEEAGRRERQGLTRHLRECSAPRPGMIDRDGRTLVNFASNDYLGLAADPRVAEAARQATMTDGWGAGASPLVSGWRPVHANLSRELAEFEKAEAALLFPTGFAANLGTIAALAEAGDAVYTDRLAHACLVAGAKLSGASLRVFPHNDVDRLADVLGRERTRYRRVLIATEGVFSMDGDLAPLADLARIADQFDAMLLVDEAHGTGVYGPDGRGGASECGVADQIPVRVGTLSKAFGSLGGFVAGSARLIDHLVNHASSFVYSTALPPAAATAALEALRLSRAEPWRRERARALGHWLRDDLTTAGFSIGRTEGPIVPVIIGDPRRALELAERLHERGLLVPAIRPPTVPKGTSRLRISLSAAHSDEQVSLLIDVLAELRNGDGSP